MKNIRKPKTGKSMLYSVGFGLGSSVIISVICTGVIAMLIIKESLSLSTTTLVMPAVQLLSAFVGCLIAGQTACDNKAIASGVVCISYYLLAISVAALFMEGISGKFWVGMIMDIVGYLGAILLCIKERSSVRRGKRRRARS